MPQKESQTRWERENTMWISIKLNHRTDADIIEYLNRQPSKMGCIKEALREQMKKEGI